jgi:hypothetical protein
MSDPSIRPSPTPAGPVTDDAAKAATYRPLCILAVVGAGLGGVYTVVVILGGLAAFLRGDPWLLPGWTVLFPVTAAVLSLLGLLQIQRSEGTLAGEKVARWGLLLSVLVGLSYWAYVGATYYAITSGADRFARGFMDELARGKVLRAFRLALPPAERPPEDANLRAQLEGRFNGSTDPRSKGHLTRFSESDLARLLGHGSDASQVESLGVEDWKYGAGGYQVQMLYRVTTPQAVANFVVSLQGKEGKGSEGRQWYVVLERTGVKMNTMPEPTAEGARLYQLTTQARDYVGREWTGFLQAGNAEEAFLGTLPPAERGRLRESAELYRGGLVLADALGAGALPCATPAAAVAAVALAADKDLGREASLPGYEAFLAGGLVRGPKDVFWAPEEAREEIISLLRQQFSKPNDALARALKPDTGVHFPLVREEGDRLVVEHDLTIRVPPSAEPRYMVDARIVTEGVATGSAPGPRAWRVTSIDLVSGKSVPKQPPGMPMP